MSIVKTKCIIKMIDIVEDLIYNNKYEEMLL